jgi:hypothetical protein
MRASTPAYSHGSKASPCQERCSTGTPQSNANHREFLTRPCPCLSSLVGPTPRDSS